MNRTQSSAAISIAGLLLLGASTPPPPAATTLLPAYRAVITPAFVSQPWEKKAFEELPVLATALNALASEGYEPIEVVPIVDDLKVAKGEYRFVITAKRP